MQPRHITALSRPLRGKLIPIGLALTVVLGAHVACADPVRLVTSGGAYQIPNDGETGWDLFGDHFWFGGDGLQLSPLTTLSCGYPCTAGTSMNLSATISPRSAGAATVGDVTYQSVYYTGQFIFTAGSITVPALSPDSTMRPGPTTPFTFVGSLSGYADPRLTGAPLFSTALMGTGLANVGFFNDSSSNGVYADGFDYLFTDSAVTPEPASLVLIATGAAWLCRRRTAA
jgi:hypothetical protein